MFLLHNRTIWIPSEQQHREIRDRKQKYTVYLYIYKIGYILIFTAYPRPLKLGILHRTPAAVYGATFRRRHLSRWKQNGADCSPGVLVPTVHLMSGKKSEFDIMVDVSRSIATGTWGKCWRTDCLECHFIRGGNFKMERFFFHPDSWRRGSRTTLNRTSACCSRGVNSWQQQLQSHPADEFDAQWGTFEKTFLGVKMMSEPSDRNAPEEPSNWILQHPAVSLGSQCCIQVPRVQSRKSRIEWLFQYQLMKALGTDDCEQRHAAFLVYMDLSEGECPPYFAFLI